VGCEAICQDTVVKAPQHTQLNPLVQNGDFRVEGGRECVHPELNFMTGVERRPHPDTAVAHGGSIRRALCVDVGLWVMNSTFHLSQNGSNKRLR